MSPKPRKRRRRIARAARRRHRPASQPQARVAV